MDTKRQNIKKQRATLCCIFYLARQNRCTQIADFLRFLFYFKRKNKTKLLIYLPHGKQKKISVFCRIYY